MTILSFNDNGVDVIYKETGFHLEETLIEEAIGKSYPGVTGHEVLRAVEKQPVLSGEPRRVRGILNSS